MAATSMASSIQTVTLARSPTGNGSKLEKLAACNNTGSLLSWPRLQPHSACQWRQKDHRSSSLVCQASEKGKVEAARETQVHATDLLAQLLKAENLELCAREHVDSFTQEFFMIASTYLSMAKKEGNAEVVSRLETVLKTAMAEREKTLRPEIQLLNQLLRDSTASERAKTMERFVDYLKSDSYFFQLLNRMTMDVERQPDGPSNPEKNKLLSQLHSIRKEAKDVSKNLKRAAIE